MVWNRAPPYTHIISEPASDIFQNTRWKPAMRGPTGRLTGGHTGQRAWSAEQFARPRSKRTALGRVGGATSGDGNRLLGLESMAIAADQEGIAAAVPPSQSDACAAARVVGGESATDMPIRRTVFGVGPSPWRACCGIIHSPNLLATKLSTYHLPMCQNRSTCGGLALRSSWAHNPARYSQICSTRRTEAARSRQTDLVPEAWDR